MKRILILGSGMVAGPIIKYLLGNGYLVTIASNTPERAKELIGIYKKGTAIEWDAKDTATLDLLISEHDLVVSLLPFAFHFMVAEKCIEHKTNMVTTSYVREGMKALDKKAKDAGILILNECGLDPGIDHMSAKRIIDTIHGFGGKVIEFYSICGALPAPEVSEQNPYRYKFTWSPKGVLYSADSNAKYLKDGKKITISSSKLFNDVFTLDYPKIGAMEVYPNRDALPYVGLYDIPETKTMYRGTFRFPGWCESLHNIKKLGLLNQEEIDLKGQTLSDILSSLIGAKSKEDLKKNVAKKLKITQGSVSIKALEYLGFFDDLPVNKTKDSLFNVLSELMVEKMMIHPEERDMSVLQHIFRAEYPDGREEVIKSNLLDYGAPNSDTSIARTVALPAACAAKLILEDEIKCTGVHIPVLPEIYNPIMIELENLGIEMVEEYGLPLVDGKII